MLSGHREVRDWCRVLWTMPGGADRSLPYTIAPSHPPCQHKIKKIQSRKDTNDVKRLQQISKDEDRSLPYTIAPLRSHPP